jgi:hypothetical protein
MVCDQLQRPPAADLEIATRSLSTIEIDIDVLSTIGQVVVRGMRSSPEVSSTPTLTRVEQIDLSFYRRAWDGVAAKRQLAVLPQPGA